MLAVELGSVCKTVSDDVFSPGQSTFDHMCKAYGLLHFNLLYGLHSQMCFPVHCIKRGKKGHIPHKRPHLFSLADVSETTVSCFILKVY